MSIHGRDCRSFLDDLDREDLRSIKVAIRRNDIPLTDNPSPLRRRIECPEKLKVHLSSHKYEGRKLYWRKDVNPNLCALKEEKCYPVNLNCRDHYGKEINRIHIKIVNKKARNNSLSPQIRQVCLEMLKMGEESLLKTLPLPWETTSLRNDIDIAPAQRVPEKLNLHRSSVPGRKIFWREDVRPNLCALEYFDTQKNWSVDQSGPSSKTSKAAIFGGNYINMPPSTSLPGEEKSRHPKTSYNIEYTSNRRRDSISPKHHRSRSRSPSKRYKESTYIPDRSSRGSRSPRHERRWKSPLASRYKRRSFTRSRSRSRHSRSRSKETKRTRNVRRSRSLTPLKPGEYRPGYPRRTSKKERRPSPPPENERREKRRSRSPKSRGHRSRRSNSPSYYQHGGHMGYPAPPPQTYAILLPNFPGGWPERPMGPFTDFSPMFNPFPYGAPRPRFPMIPRGPQMIRSPIQYNTRKIPTITTATATSTSVTVSEAASSSHQQSAAISKDDNKND